MRQCLISRPSPATIPRMPSLARSHPAYMEPWSSGRFLTQTIKHFTELTDKTKHTETQTNIPRKDIVPYTRYNQHTVLVSEERRMILTMMTPRSGMMMMKTTDECWFEWFDIVTVLFNLAVIHINSAILLYFVHIKIKLPDTFIFNCLKDIFCLNFGFNVYP